MTNDYTATTSDYTATTSPRPQGALIALDRDVVIEGDIHRLLGGETSIATTRIPLGRVGSVEHLVELRDHIPDAVRLLAASQPAVIAFGCTSGVAAIGADVIRRLIAEAADDVAVVDPLSAMAEGMERMEVTRLALVTPYPAPIADLLAAWFDTASFDVVANTRVAKDATQHYADIGVEAIRSAALMARASDPAGYVIACTDLRTLHLIDELEAELGRPVMTSNQALAWAVAGEVRIDVEGPGAIFNAH